MTKKFLKEIDEKNYDKEECYRIINIALQRGLITQSEKTVLMQVVDLRNNTKELEKNIKEFKELKEYYNKHYKGMLSKTIFGILVVALGFTCIFMFI